ncbi:ROK family protein [Kitasatospora sp. NPDC054939]
MPAPPLRPAVRSGDDRRDVNAAAVLRAVLDRGPLPRSRVAALTGLSPAAVSRQVVDLVRLGLLRERPELSAGGAVGRPLLPVDVDTGRLAVAGVHVGVPYTTFSLLDLRGNVLRREEFSNRGRTGQAVLRPVLARLPRFLAAVGHPPRPDGAAPPTGSGGHAGHAARTVVGLGAVTGGSVDPVRGVTVRHAPLDWHEVPLRELLERATGLPVRVDNHARALAQSEILFGRPAARRGLVQLFVGHVVDAALGIGGQVHLGPRAATGDVAHLRVSGSRALCECGRRGCFAAAASDTALFEAAATAGITGKPDRAELIAAVRAGDRRAERLVLRRARMIGEVAALLIDVVNPDLLVLTETFSAVDPRFLDAVRAEVAERSYLVRGAGPVERLVVAQQHGADALAVAAGAAALAAVYADPLRTVAPAVGVAGHRPDPYPAVPAAPPATTAPTAATAALELTAPNGRATAPDRAPTRTR